MKWSLIIIVFISLHTYAQKQTCSQVVLPQFSGETKKNLEKKLADAKSDYDQDSSDADAIIWYGRRTAYLGHYERAIEIFSRGTKLHPQDARMYRHRGHRYITARCFDKAIMDLKKATQLIKGKPDEKEPDGLPNAKNIPTSTLQSNIWYHLGLAYFLEGEYKNAKNAYDKCLKVSDNQDMYVATANWMYITLRKLNKITEAQKLLDTIKPDVELLESGDYLKILLLYKQQTGFADPIKEVEDNNTLSSATYGFGLGNYLLLNGKPEQAKKIFEKIVTGNQWSSFGFIAAEAELARMK